jgi:hypothetical protein
VTSLPLGFMLDADAGERLRFSDADVVIKASADTTGGAFAIVEEIAPLDTPLHVHEREDEVFYMFSPAGFEGFFRELAEAERAGTIGPGAYAEASKRYGLTWLR